MPCRPALRISIVMAWSPMAMPWPIVTSAWSRREPSGAVDAARATVNRTDHFGEPFVTQRSR